MAPFNKFAPDHKILTNKDAGVFGVSQRINSNNASRLEVLKAAFTKAVGKLESPPLKSASSVTAFMEGALLQASSLAYLVPSLQLTALGKVLPYVVGDDLTALSLGAYYLACDATILALFSPAVALVVSASYLSCELPEEGDEEGYASTLASSANRSFIN